jgi:hypothetical protein
MILRAAATLVALALLGAAAHAIISHTEGYGSPHALMTLALAAGIAVGALSIGAAWRQRRRALAIVLGFGLVCGELFGLLSTAERLIAQRENAQAPVREAIAQREAARHEVAGREAALIAARESPRLASAEAAKRAADRAAIDKAAERGCATNCRALLEQQVIDAAREVREARGEVAEREAAALAALAGARARLAALRVPPSPTPLADRLGLPGWTLDVLVASLGSIAANGLAAALLAFAGHSSGTPHRAPSASAPAATSAPRETVDAHPIAAQVKLPVANVREHAALFGLECLEPAPDRHAPLGEIRQIYAGWCEAKGVAALPDAEIGGALADLFSAAGLRVRKVEGQLAIVGAAIRQRTQIVQAA